MDSRYFFAVFFTVFSVLASSAQENRFFIDLQKFPLYIKADFNPSDAVSPNLQDGSWEAKEQWPGAVIRRLGLPGLPKRPFLSPWGRPEQEWTFVVPFTMDASLLDDDVTVIPCLYLASIGVNWKIYLNGILLKKEMHLANGRIIRPGCQIPLNDVWHL